MIKKITDSLSGVDKVKMEAENEIRKEFEEKMKELFKDKMRSLEKAKLVVKNLETELEDLYLELQD